MLRAPGTDPLHQLRRRRRQRRARRMRSIREAPRGIVGGVVLPGGGEGRGREAAPVARGPLLVRNQFRSAACAK